MFYEFAVTTPANTAATSPVTTEITLAAGVVTFVEVQFPRGCVGLAHARIRDALHQVAPANDDGDIAGEDARISWTEQWELKDKLNTLQLVTWNLDDTYPHTITFRFNLVPMAQWRADQQAQSGLRYLGRYYAGRA